MYIVILRSSSDNFLPIVGFVIFLDEMETDEADKEAPKSEEKKEPEKDKTSSSGRNNKDSEMATQPIKEEKMETEIKMEEEEESKSADSAVINGNQDENTNDEDIEDVRIYIYIYMSKVLKLIWRSPLNWDQVNSCLFTTCLHQCGFCETPSVLG